MIVIFARNAQDAKAWANEKGLHPIQWVYASSVDSIRGLRPIYYVCLPGFLSHSNVWATLEMTKYWPDAAKVFPSDPLDDITRLC